MHDIILKMDQPSYDGLNTYLITKILKQNNYKVAISGLGADELFGGYNTFQRMKFLNSVKFFYKNFIFKYFLNLLHKLFQQNKYIFFLNYYLSITIHIRFIFY